MAQAFTFSLETISHPPPSPLLSFPCPIPKQFLFSKPPYAQISSFIELNNLGELQAISETQTNISLVCKVLDNTGININLICHQR